jgi:hypothetical protein
VVQGLQLELMVIILLRIKMIGSSSYDLKRSISIRGPSLLNLA